MVSWCRSIVVLCWVTVKKTLCFSYMELGACNYLVHGGGGGVPTVWPPPTFFKLSMTPTLYPKIKVWPPPPPQCHICGFKKNYKHPLFFCYPIGLPNGWQTIFELYSALRFFDGLPPPPPRPNGEALRGNFWETFVSPPLAQEKGTHRGEGGGGGGTKKD